MADRTLLRVAAAAGALTFVLAGCGSSDNAAAPAASSAAPSAAATSSAAPGTDTAANKPKCTPEEAKKGATPSTKPLRVGTLLPETGSLAFLGPPEIAGVQLAANDVNAAGGVLGKPIVVDAGDSGDTTTDTANQTVDREIAAGDQVIIGAASSSVSLKVIDKIVNAGVIEFSPANTSDQFTCYKDKGLYFRTAPADTLQARALAQIMGQDGIQRLSILALNDPYGTGLAENISKDLQSAGLKADQIQTIIYDPNAASFNAEVDKVKQFNPDGIAVIGFDESKKIITRMKEVGIGPDKKSVYGSDGNMGNALGEGLPAGLLNGMKGTTPLTDTSADFKDRLKKLDPKLVDFNYAGESYDAVVITALGAEVAKSTAGVDMASEMNGVTKDGTKCKTYAECLPLIKAGTNIDYDGVTGTLDFTSAGEPGKGSYGVLTFGPDNKLGTPTYIIAG
ncbi:MAG: ABC transporter substrate-binding protein [Mycobacteriaceae bacterium]